MLLDYSVMVLIQLMIVPPSGVLSLVMT